MKKTLIAIALMSTFSYANAADIDNTWYIGAGAGQSNFESVSVDSDGYLGDDSDFAWDALIGYQFNQYLAIEAGWQDLGTVDDNHMRTNVGQEIEVDGYTLGLVGTLPLNDKWFLTAEAGAYQYHLGHQIDNDRYVSATDTAAYFGAGFGYNITDALSVAAKYRRFEGIDETEWDTADMDAQTFGIQVTYRFGVKAAAATAAVVAPVVVEQEETPAPVTPVYETKVEQSNVAILFGFDSSELTAESKAKLDKIIELSKNSDNDKILLDGHSDNQGDATYNQKLSERRVQQVSDYLTSNGVEVQSMDMQAEGEEGSHADNKQDRALERRVTVTLTSETQVQVN